MKQLKTFLISLISLTLIPVNSLAEDSAILLEKDEKAPFSGVLIKEQLVRELKTKAEDSDRYKLITESLERSIDIYKENETLYTSKVKLLVERNDSLSASLESARDTSDLTKILWFGLGVVASGLAVYGAKAITK